MPDQEFLASFGVQIDESGVNRLQQALEQNRTLAHTSSVFSLFYKPAGGMIPSALTQEQMDAIVALGTLTIQDAAGGFSVVCTGVTLQKVPARVFDRTGTNLTYTLLATTITDQ